VSGIAAEQIANDPNGRLFASQTERAMRAILAVMLTDTVDALLAAGQQNRG